MRLLAFSDIHNNLVAVRRMRARERNSFDAIVVAGDIGNDAAPRFFEIMATFECPVVYVFGNWDHKLSSRTSYGPSLIPLHFNVVTIGNLHFNGFNGLASGRILQANRKRLRNIIARMKIDPRRIVVVTHARLTRLMDVAPSPLLHLYGHIHRFSERKHKETTLVNVSALDRPVTARPRSKRQWKPEDCRNFNADNYVIIQVDSTGKVQVTRVDLSHDYPKWIPLDGQRHNGIEWIDKEKKWTSSSDPKLIRYWQSIAR